MEVFSAEKVQEIVEEKEAEYKKLEEKYSYLKEEYGELEEECQELKRERKNIPLKVKSVYLSQNHITELERITELENAVYKAQEINKELYETNLKLSKSLKTANIDFFILAVAYSATLMLMIYLFIR
jgi:predicted RNase H-like nuclease (RuvC/YqgF family)